MSRTAINPATGYSDDIDYSQLNPNEKRAKALEDVVEYWGMLKFMRVVNLYRKEYPNGTDFFKMHMAMAGVQGFPVTALYEFIYGFEDPEGTE